MNVKKQQAEYSKLVKQKSPPSTIFKDILLSFLIGGTICVIGQLINMFVREFYSDAEKASSITSSAMIFLGAFLTGTGLYDNIAKYGKAGTLVPITGFANSIVSPAMEYKTEGYIMGVGSKMFTIAGAVLVYGISASVIYGVLYRFLLL